MTTGVLCALPHIGCVEPVMSKNTALLLSINVNSMVFLELPNFPAAVGLISMEMSCMQVSSDYMFYIRTWFGMNQGSFCDEICFIT